MKTTIRAKSEYRNIVELDPFRTHVFIYTILLCFTFIIIRPGVATDKTLIETD